MIAFFKTLKDDDRGATAIEYGLIVALIFFGMMAGMMTFAKGLTDMWNDVDQTINEVIEETT